MKNIEHNPDMDERLKMNSELLKSAAIDELYNITYFTTDKDIDYKRMELLIKLIDEPDIIPEEFQPEAFFKRFGEKYDIKNISKQITTNRKTQKQSIRSEKKHIKYRHLSIAAALTVFIIVVCSLKIVVYANEKQSIFKLISDKFNMLMFETDIIVDDKVNTDYYPLISNSSLPEGDLNKLKDMFEAPVYVPSVLPSWVADGFIEFNDCLSYRYASILYLSKDDYEKIYIEMYEISANTKAYIINALADDNVKSEYYFKINNDYEVIHIYGSDSSFTQAYMTMDNVMYTFMFYNIEYDMIIKFFENLEEYK